jgi:hypothetical protein
MIPSDIAYSTNTPRGVGESQPRHSPTPVLGMAGVVAAMQRELAHQRRRRSHLDPLACCANRLPHLNGASLTLCRCDCHRRAA